MCQHLPTIVIAVPPSVGRRRSSGSRSSTRARAIKAGDTSAGQEQKALGWTPALNPDVFVHVLQIIGNGWVIIYKYIWLHICIYTYNYVYVYVYLYLCLYVIVCMIVYVYMYVYVHVYVYAWCVCARGCTGVWDSPGITWDMQMVFYPDRSANDPTERSWLMFWLVVWNIVYFSIYQE